MAIKFQNNQALTLRFPFGDFLAVNGQYGQQYLYTVEVEGRRERLYAPAPLHAQLQQVPVAPDSLLTITRTDDQDSNKRWQVDVPQLAETDVAADANGTRAVPMGQPPGRPTFAQMQHLLRHCLQTSWTAWNELDEDCFCTSEDVRALGISLFLECARKGVLPPLETLDQASADYALAT